MKNISKILTMSILSVILGACNSKKQQGQTIEIPEKTITWSLSFPDDLIYQTSPDSTIILGRKRVKAGLYEISAFEKMTAKKLWKLPFLAEIIGQTATHILVYEEATSSVYFINPSDGQTSRKISPAPNPLTSKSGFYLGMAFTDNLYITTKALYTQVLDKDKIDESFSIGITAKTWENNEKKWFVPPVKQIVSLTYKPIIKNDKLLIINTLQSIDGGHSYQVVDLETGIERSRTTTEGEFMYLNEKYFIEKTAMFIRCFDPFSGKEFWKISGDFAKAQIHATQQQITVQHHFTKRSRTVLILDPTTGNLLKTFELPRVTDANITHILLTPNGDIWLHANTEIYKIEEERSYDYWIGYDEVSQKSLWRTDYASRSLSSLIRLLPPEL